MLGSVQDVTSKGGERLIAILVLKTVSNITVCRVGVVENLVLVGGDEPLERMPDHGEGDRGIRQRADGQQLARDPEQGGNDLVK